LGRRQWLRRRNPTSGYREWRSRTSTLNSRPQVGITILKPHRTSCLAQLLQGLKLSPRPSSRLNVDQSLTYGSVDTVLLIELLPMTNHMIEASLRISLSLAVAKLTNVSHSLSHLSRETGRFAVLIGAISASIVS